MVAAPYVLGVIRFVILLLFLCWAPAHGDDSLPKWLQEPGQIIEGPIDVNDCILIEWLIKKDDEGRFTFPRRPMDPVAIQSVYTLRKQGVIKVYSCQASGA